MEVFKEYMPPKFCKRYNLKNCYFLYDECRIEVELKRLNLLVCF